MKQSEALDALRRLGPLTQLDLAVLHSVTTRAVGVVLKPLHKRGQVHISAFRKRDAGPAARVWALGPGTDAERPKPKRPRKMKSRNRQHFLLDDLPNRATTAAADETIARARALGPSLWGALL